MAILATLLLLLSLVGSGHMLNASLAVARFGRRAALPAVAPEPVSLLKPLHGGEPRLAENLATFLDQDWNAPIQLVAGVQRENDPAIEVAQSLSSPAEAGEREVDLVLDATPHGANAKVANLINMMPAAKHGLLIQSDSDMAVPREYVAAVAAALAQPGVGAVTCLYRGRGDAGGWSVLAAGTISYGFLPGVLVALATGLGEPSMGSTIALRRETLDQIGGFDALADQLADDFELGQRVRGLGLGVSLAPIVLEHAFAERSFAAVWRHELRWAATTRAIVPWAYLGTIATHPIPFALLALPLAPVWSAAALALGVATRLILKRQVDRLCGASAHPAWWLPGRDILSFVVFLASFFVRSVDWRGRRLRMGGDGRVSAEPESPHL